MYEILGWFFPHGQGMSLYTSCSSIRACCNCCFGLLLMTRLSHFKSPQLLI